jgi:hypothetical protein
MGEPLGDGDHIGPTSTRQATRELPLHRGHYFRSKLNYFGVRQSFWGFSCCAPHLVSGVSGPIIALAGPLHGESRKDALSRTCNLTTFVRQRERADTTRENMAATLSLEKPTEQDLTHLRLRPTAARSRCYADRSPQSSRYHGRACVSEDHPDGLRSHVFRADKGRLFAETCVTKG